jgi:drug/metabolite transporter (DMT)-like permease
MFIESHSNEIALFSAILLTAFSQLVLRIGAKNKAKSSEIFLNVATISGYLLFFIVILLTIYAMQKIQLKTAMAWNSTTYILTPTLGYLLIKEPLDKRMILGSVIIVIGLLIFIL